MNEKNHEDLLREVFDEIDQDLLDFDDDGGSDGQEQLLSEMDEDLLSEEGGGLFAGQSGEDLDELSTFEPGLDDEFEDLPDDLSFLSGIEGSEPGRDDGRVSVDSLEAAELPETEELFRGLGLGEEEEPHAGFIDPELGFVKADEDEDFGTFPGIDDYQIDGETSDTDTDQAEGPGFNWGAVFSAIVFFLSLGTLAYQQNEATREAEALSMHVSEAGILDANLKDLRVQALLVPSDGPGAMDRFRTIEYEIDNMLDLLRKEDVDGGMPPLPEDARNLVLAAEGMWSQIKPRLEFVHGNADSIEAFSTQLFLVDNQLVELLSLTDTIEKALLESEAGRQMVSLAGQQRFLAQKMRTTISQFPARRSGWELTLESYSKDLGSFKRNNSFLRRQGPAEVSGLTADADSLHRQLVTSAGGLEEIANTYFSMRATIDEVLDYSTEVENRVRLLSGVLMERNSEASWVQPVPLVSGLVALLSLAALLMTIMKQLSKVRSASQQRSQVSEDAVIRLLDEMGDLAQGDLTVEAEVTDEVTGAIADSINFAVAEMRDLVQGIKTAANEMNEATEGTESLIANLLTSSDAQSEEILSSADEVSNMTEAINRMSASAARSSKQAKVSAEVAQKGADAVRNTVRGINTARSQIMETSKQLKRLGESSQQINEIVTLIQDVTEQTNVLSLNASIQAAMAGEAGRGFAVVAEEVQRLAERAASASNEITELVKNIQQDASSAITSMESTTEEVVAGARTADEAGQALTEIEMMSEELLKTIENVEQEATRESEVAQTVAGRIQILQEATKESDLSVSQVAISMEQMRAVASRLNQSIAGFKLPETG